MKKKLLLVLLVVLMVGILAFSVFACQPKDDGKKEPDKKPSNEPTEEVVDVKAGPMFNALFDSIDNTIKVVNDIKDEASVSADLYVDILADGKTYNVDLSISGSIDAGTKANNWALVTANVLGVEIGLFAEETSEGKEYLYLGQNILNEEVEWSKLSQAESAELLGGKAVPALLGLVAGLDGEEYTDANGNGKYDEGEKFVDVNGNNTWDSGKFAANEPYTDANEDGKYTPLTKDKEGKVTYEGDPFEDLDDNGVWTETTFNGADITDTIASGLLKKVGLIGTIRSAINMIGGTLFAPIDGINTIEDGECDLTSDNGYAARLNIKDLSAVIGGLGGLLDGLLTKEQAKQFQPLVDLAVPIILGGQFNLSDFTFTPGTAVPEIQLFVDINSDKTFGGLHLSYEHDVDLDPTDSKPAKHIKVAFGLDNISFKANSASKPSAIVKEVEGAEELAINLGLDLEIGAIENETGINAAQFDLNVYPNLAIKGFGEDGYLDIDFSKLYAEVVMTYKAFNNDTEDDETDTKDVSVVVAQYNVDGYEDLVIDLGSIGNQFGAFGLGVYKVPVNLQEKFDNWASPKASVASNAGEEPEKGLVDSILGIVGGIINKPADKKLDIVGLIMDVAGLLGTIVDEAEALSDYVAAKDGVATIDVEGLILALIAEDGLIGESKDSITIDGGEGKDDIVIAPGEIAKDLAKDKVLAYIAKLAGIEVADIIGLVKDFTGATLNAGNAYDNMEITATGYAKDGIGATISAVLGSAGVDESEQPYEPATISISLSANIIDNITEYGDEETDISFYDEKHYVVVDGENVLFATNTGDDNGAKLLNAVKLLFNAIVTDSQFELSAFENWDMIGLNSPASGETGIVNPWMNKDDPFVVNKAGTYYYYGMFGQTWEYTSVAPCELLLNVGAGVDVVPMVYETNPANPEEGRWSESMEGPIALVEGVATIAVDAGETVRFTIYNMESADEALNIFGLEVAYFGTADKPLELVIGQSITTADFVYGMDGVTEYIYTYTATADCTLTIACDNPDATFKEGREMDWGFAYADHATTYTLTAGQTILIAVANEAYDAEWNRDATGVTFTATVAQNG
ncbi:MAG: hypothetical protein IKB56_05270 [Clostridia bacterium]|nr:hypothetical protein [Clostridia bacterium]